MSFIVLVCLSVFCSNRGWMVSFNHPDGMVVVGGEDKFINTLFITELVGDMVVFTNLNIQTY